MGHTVSEGTFRIFPGGLAGGARARARGQLPPLFCPSWAPPMSATFSYLYELRSVYSIMLRACNILREKAATAFSASVCLSVTGGSVKSGAS